MAPRTHILDVPFELRMHASSLGARYDKDLRLYVYVGDKLPEALSPYASKDHSWERYQEDELNRVIKAPTLTGNVFTPRDYQKEAGARMNSFIKKGCRGFLLADEVGLGKSISALLGAYAVAKHKGFTKEKPMRLLIVCPKAVIPHWRNTLNSMPKLLEVMRVVIINYERLPKLLDIPESAKNAKRTSTKNKRIASSGKPLIRWDAIIADESHRLKNHQKSQRSKAFARVARHAESAKQAPFVMWVSATIGQDPMEVGYLAPLIGQVTKTTGLRQDSWGQYLNRQGYHVTEGKVGWSWIAPRWDGSNQDEVLAKRRADIAKMRKLLFSPSFPSIRRLPEDIAGWPNIQRVPVPVDLTPEQRILYKEAWTEFRKFLEMNPQGKDPQGSLAQQLRFRQKASLLRVAGTVDFVDSLLENGHQVAISVEFVESLDAIKEALEGRGHKVVEYSGRNNEDRESERLKFQKGQASVVLFTSTEGISLHAGEILPDGTKATSTRRATVVHDVRYSSIMAAQIEGRAHRDGQSANVYYIYAEDTVEKKIVDRMLQRMSDMRTLSGDSSDILDLLYQVISRVRGR